jgi:uncharacterized protein
MPAELPVSSGTGDAIVPSSVRLLVLQSTPFCNIDCSYCYLPDRTAQTRMSDAVLEAIGVKLLQSGLVSTDLPVLWHAGEPLVLGPDYYQNAFDVLRRGAPRSITLRHKFQTNGTLLTRRWCDFFRDHDVSVGLSLDGPARFHDRHRRTRGGSGTFAKVLQAAEMLTAHGLPFYVICVLTARSLDHADEFFDFFEALGVRRVLLNIEEIEGANHQSSLDRAGIEARYKIFLSRYFDRLRDANSGQSVRELHDTVSNILAHRMTPIRNTLTQPFSSIAVDTEGNVSTFSPELLAARDRRYGKFVFGNLLTGRIEDMLRSPKFEAVAAEIAAGVDACRRECVYFPVCGGGWPSNKLAETGRFDGTETLYCRLTVKTVTDLVLAKLAEGDAPALRPAAAALVSEPGRAQ